MPRDVDIKSTEDDLTTVTDRVEVFLSQGEGYGAIRELGYAVHLVEQLPKAQQLRWRDRIGSLSPTTRDIEHAVIKSKAEIERVQRLLTDAPKLLDEEFMLVLSNTNGVLLATSYISRTEPVPWSSALNSLVKEIANLREDDEVGPAIRRCEKTIRRNSRVYLL